MQKISFGVTGDDELKRYEVMLELFFECMVILLQVVFFLFLLPKLAGFMWPFLIGGIIAMITYPLSVYVQKKFHINKKYVYIMILIGLLSAISFLLYFLFARLGRESIDLMSDIPVLYEKTKIVLEDFFVHMQSGSWFPASWRFNIDSLWISIKEAIGPIVNRIGTIGVSNAGMIAKNVTNFLIGFIVSILSSYFFVVYWEKMVEEYRRLVPHGMQEKAGHIIEQIKGAVGGYFIAQIKIMAIIAAILFAGLLLMKNPYALLLAVIIAIVDVLPFLGTGFILMPWAVYEILSGSLQKAVFLIVLYVICLLGRQLLQPKIIGDSVGLHPMVTLVLIYAGFKIAGIKGFLIAMIGGILLRNLYRIGLFDNKIRRFKKLYNSLREADEQL